MKSNTRNKVIGALLIVLMIAIAFVLIKAKYQSAEASFNLSKCSTTKEGTINQTKLTSCFTKSVKEALRNNSNLSAVIRAINPQIEAHQPNSERIAISQVCASQLKLIGREYAETKNINISNINNYWQQIDSFDCASEFAKGLFLNIPINKNNLQQITSVCLKQKSKAGQELCFYSTGIALRHSKERNQQTVKPALEDCQSLPVKYQNYCAQGVYEDYFFAANLAGRPTYQGSIILPPEVKDGSTVDQRFCIRQKEKFRVQCWLQGILANPANNKNKELGEKGLIIQCPQNLGTLQKECAQATAFTIFNFDSTPKNCSTLSYNLITPCLRGSLLARQENIQLPSQDNQPVKYNKKPIKSIISDCLLMPNVSTQNSCAFWMAYRAGRILPILNGPNKAQICSNLKIYNQMYIRCQQGLLYSQR